MKSSNPFVRCEEKVPNGKLVCFDVDSEGGTITNVRITGDFFLHPEDAIIEIEKSLIGIPADCNESEITEKISSALKGAQLIGATAGDFARIFKKALSCGE